MFYPLSNWLGLYITLKIKIGQVELKERIKRLVIKLTHTAEGSFDAIMSHRH